MSEQVGKVQTNKLVPTRQYNFKPGNKWAWKPGQTGNPAGRPKASNVERMVRVLLELAGKGANLKKLRDHAQAEFDKDPLNFVVRFIYPLLPKTAMLGLTMDEDGPLIKVLVGVDLEKV